MFKFSIYCSEDEYNFTQMYLKVYLYFCFYAVSKACEDRQLGSTTDDIQTVISTMIFCFPQISTDMRQFSKSTTWTTMYHSM